MTHCAVHGPDVEACDETEGWNVRLCSLCFHGLGQPCQSPSWGAVYAIGITLMAAEEQRSLRANEHPEALTNHAHFPQAHQLAANE